MRHELVVLLGITVLLLACRLPSPRTTGVAPTTAAATAVPTEAHLPNVDWLAYHDDEAGFTVQYPLTWRQSDSGAYPIVFVLEAAPGTTLLEKTMELNFTDQIAECKQSIYGSDSGSTSPEHVRINGVDFLKEAGGRAGAGNIYDWTSYPTVKGVHCITVTFVLHSANAGVYSTEPAPFDRAAESEIFGQLLSTFRFDPQ
jgi:hypothetical protein